MERKTGTLRVLLAMIFGAVIGANLSMGLLVFRVGPPPSAEAMKIWGFILVYWLIGMVVFAVIPFVLLHLSNLRQWYAMTAIGTMTMLALSMFFFKGIGDVTLTYSLAAIGGIVGWVVWRVAYKRISKKDGK